MISRVTQQTVSRSTLANLQTNLATAAALQNQMSSGQKISKPSDDPSGTSASMRLRGEQRAATQYARNADDGTAWLTMVDTAMMSSVSAMQSARDLAVQSGNTGALNASGREGIAAAIDGVKKQLLSLANTQYLGRTVFAGTSDKGAAYTVSTAGGVTSYTANDVPGSSVQRRVSEDTTVRVDAAASSVFGDDADPANPSVFALLDQMAATVRGGGSAAGSITAIDSRITAVAAQQAAVGARENQVTSAQSVLADRQLGISTQLSSLNDVDLAEMTLKIQQQSVTYQGALAAAGKSLQPSLMDYLK
jgi:flagellar hook-associated protein 3 FlgL